MAKHFFVLFFAFVCCKLILLPVNAVEQKAYKTVTNRDIIYVVEQDGTFSYSWQFDKQNYKNDVDFSLRLLNTSPYRNKINSKIDNDIKRQYLFFEHHGTLPTDALMKIKVSDDFKDGQELFLYYYNDATDKLEYIDNHLTIKNGMVEFKIKHCSDYILTASIVRTAMDNPQSLGIVIITLIILGVLLVAATLFINNKK